MIEWGCELLEPSRLPIFHYAYRPLLHHPDGDAGFSVTVYAGGALAFCVYSAERMRTCSWFRLDQEIRAQVSCLLEGADGWLAALPSFYFPCEAQSSRSQIYFWNCAPLTLDEMDFQFRQARPSPVPGIFQLAGLFQRMTDLLRAQGFYLTAEGFHWEERCVQILPPAAQQEDQPGWRFG